MSTKKFVKCDGRTHLATYHDGEGSKSYTTIRSYLPCEVYYKTEAITQIIHMENTEFTCDGKPFIVPAGWYIKADDRDLRISDEEDIQSLLS